MGAVDTRSEALVLGGTRALLLCRGVASLVTRSAVGVVLGVLGGGPRGAIE
jgi:hypothetical protein